MAMTETIQKLYVDGEWYETGETRDITSPLEYCISSDCLPTRSVRAANERALSAWSC